MKHRVESICTIIGISLSQLILQELGYERNIPNSMIAGAIGAVVFGFVGHYVLAIISMFSRKGKNIPYIGDNISIDTTPSISTEIPDQTKPLYIGYGGWLILFSVGLAFQFFLNLKGLYDNYLFTSREDFLALTNINSEYYNSLWEPTILYEMIIQGYFSFAIIIIAFFMIRMSKKFKIASIVYIASLLPCVLIDTFLMLSIQNGYSDEIFTSKELYYPVVGSTSYTIIWIPYMLLSKRVRNTFVMN